MKASTRQKSQFLNFYISSSLKDISTRLHIFAILSVVNLFRNPFRSFLLKLSEVFKRDVVSSREPTGK